MEKEHGELFVKHIQFLELNGEKSLKVLIARDKGY